MTNPTTPEGRAARIETMIADARAIWSREKNQPLLMPLSKVIIDLADQRDRYRKALEKLRDGAVFMDVVSGMKLINDALTPPGESDV